jgi:hypothetical protein
VRRSSADNAASHPWRARTAIVLAKRRSWPTPIALRKHRAASAVRDVVRPRFQALIAGAVLMLFVAGCGAANLPSWLLRHYLGAPSAVSTLKAQDGAVWMPSGEIAVVTWGSSGCPDLPTRLAVPTRNRLDVTAEPYDPSHASCPADLAPTTSIIKVPAALSLTEDVTVTIIDVTYGATVSLPPGDGGGYLPATGADPITGAALTSWRRPSRGAFDRFHLIDRDPSGPEAATMGADQEQGFASLLMPSPDRKGSGKQPNSRSKTTRE